MRFSRNQHGDIAHTTSSSTTTTIPIGFQGGYSDPTTGDTWMGARWYRPGTGAFTSRDTIHGTFTTTISLNRLSQLCDDASRDRNVHLSDPQRFESEITELCDSARTQ
ncbi:MAG: RHS repeat-associated core domain-containing protein [Actinomycetota bacterium]